MTAEILQSPRPLRRDANRPLRLDCNAIGGWTLSGSRGETRKFADFDAALAGARRECASPETLIEVWEDGDYICSMPPPERPANDASAYPGIAPDGPVLRAVERGANRAAQALLTAASFGFWLALMVLALGASLGWRFMLF